MLRHTAGHNTTRSRRLRKAAVGAGLVAVLATGAGFGVAHAVTGHNREHASTTSSTDRPEPGDTPDQTADQPDVAGRPDLPEAGDTPDQTADQPDVPGRPDLPEPGDTPDAAH